MRLPQRFGPAWASVFLTYGSGDFPAMLVPPSSPRCERKNRCPSRKVDNARFYPTAMGSGILRCKQSRAKYGRNEIQRALIFLVAAPDDALPRITPQAISRK